MGSFLLLANFFPCKLCVSVYVGVGGDVGLIVSTADGGLLQAGASNDTL